MSKDLKDKRIAVVGVSTDSGKYGCRIFSDLCAAGYRVEGINPKGGEVAGRQLYKTLADLPVLPDVVVTVVPPEITERIVDECRQLHIPEIWMQPGSESDVAVRSAREYGMIVTSNACIMVRNGIW